MKDGFIRVAAATPDIHVADPQYNSEQIIELMEQGSARGVKVMAFPELCLTAYTCSDLFLQESLLREAKKELKRILQASKSKDMILFVGMPWMHKGTRIINLASAAAFCPQAKFAVYAATKSYVLSFSRSLAAELKEKGIFVTAVCPGPVDTPFFEVSGKLPGGMKEAVMADPVQVVKQALIDAKYKKEVSVYGTAMKGAEAATKVLPHGMILKAMSMIEKITKE